MNCDQAALKLLGTTFAESYEIVSVLGTGGTSTVYAARYEPLDQLVALKLFRVDRGASADLVRSLKREARNAGKLKHPNIVSVLRIHQSDDGIPFLVAELAEGVPLNQLLAQRGGRLNESDFHKLFDAIMSGLEHAHLQGVVHCDLKPSNVIVQLIDNEIDTARIVDFGISKYTAPHNTSDPSLTTQGIFGTPAYMSPEQCQGKKADVRSDIYSLGCMMYECVAGQPVFAGESVFDVIQQHIRSHPIKFADLKPPPQISAAIESTVFSALQKDRLLRPQSVRELRCMLQGQLPPPSETVSAPAWAPPKKYVMGAALSVLAAVVVATVVAVIPRDKQTPDTAEIPTVQIKSVKPKAAMLVEKAEYYQRMHQYSEAARYFQLADEAWTRENKTDKQSLQFRLKIRENLSFELMKIGRHKDAQSVQLQALKLAEEIDPAASILLLENLSESSQKLQNPAAALAYAQRAREAAELACATGPQGPMNNLEAHRMAGDVYRLLSERLAEAHRDAEAEQACRQALAHDQQQLVPGLRLTDLRRIAGVQEKRGKLGEALQTMKKFDEEAKACLGSDWDELTEMSSGYEVFGDLLRRAKRFAEADIAYEQAIEQVKMVPTGMQDYNLATRMYKRAKNLFSLSKIEQAESVYKASEKHFAAIDPPVTLPLSRKQREAEIELLRATAVIDKAKAK